MHREKKVSQEAAGEGGLGKVEAVEGRGRRRTEERRDGAAKEVLNFSTFLFMHIYSCSATNL